MDFQLNFNTLILIRLLPVFSCTERERHFATYKPSLMYLGKIVCLLGFYMQDETKKPKLFVLDFVIAFQIFTKFTFSSSVTVPYLRYKVLGTFTRKDNEDIFVCANVLSFSKSLEDSCIFSQNIS